jgi:hypothetical protein
MNIKKQYKKLKMIRKENDKMIKRGQKALLKWKHYYTIEQYQNAVAYSFNPKINDLELFL